MSEFWSFTISTPLRASAEQVWAHASTFADLNPELWPLLRMTFPPAPARVRHRSVGEAAVPDPAPKLTGPPLWRSVAFCPTSRPGH